MKGSEGALNTSMNSWMQGDAGSNLGSTKENLEESFKRSMRSTASKLGRKLIAMDKEAEVKQVDKKRKSSFKKSPKSSTSQWRKY